MANESSLEPRVITAVRCHDITVSLGNKQVTDLDKVVLVGMAVRLALHLRGVPAVPYDLVKLVALHLLHIPPLALPAILDVLAEVDFVKISKRGSSILSVIPTVPFYEDMFDGIGQYAENQTLSEPERLTLEILDRLAKSPTSIQTIYNLGADRRLVNRMVDVGAQGGYVIQKRARGRDMLISPVYFSENPDAFADLAAGAGSTRVGRVVSLLSRHQGWPLALIKKTRRIGEIQLTDDDINIILTLAGDGFAPPPVIETSHAGSNHFLFSPKPGLPRLGPAKRQIYETAMALVAAVRQGQLLPAQYAIRHPIALLQALKSRKYLSANSEAMEQYRAVAILRLGRLVNEQGDRYRFELIETPENMEAVDIAIQIIRGDEPAPALEEDAVIAFRTGQTYIDSLVGRQMLVNQEKVKLDPESKREIDDFFMGI
jgi:hypothetical protein